MKRDMDCIRAILQKLEEGAFFTDTPSIPGYDWETISYHMVLLSEAGLISVYRHFTPNSSMFPIRIIARPTWEGHEFLDAARDSSRWEQAKKPCENVYSSG